MQKEARKTFGINEKILSADIREKMSNGMKPDVVVDSRRLPIKDGSVSVVFFDPPFSFHNSRSVGSDDYKRFYVTYGLNLYQSRLELGDYIEKTFQEIFRILIVGGICWLKWSESRIKLVFPLSFAPTKLQEEQRWQRPSKHFGTKTGTSTWYVWLRKVY